MSVNPVTEDIKDLLVASSLGTFAATSGWGIFLNVEPNTPDTTITLYDTGGPPPGGYANRSIHPTLYSSFLVRVRGNGYTAAHAKLQAIVRNLKEQAPFNTSGLVHYAGILRTSDILFLERDDQKRFVWVCNFQAVRKDEGA